MLNGEVGNNLENKPEDVLKTKQIFSKLGLYHDDFGLNIPFIDFELDRAIKTFQSNNDLKVDGKIYPFGETLEKIGDFIFGASQRNQFKRVIIPAPPFNWGQWTEIFAQFGVKGQKAHNNVTQLSISLSPVNQAKSIFEYEIKGGDRFIKGVGPAGSVTEIVTITGNIATAISIRAKGFTANQQVAVTVQ